jgi:hypothetical protein
VGSTTKNMNQEINKLMPASEARKIYTNGENEKARQEWNQLVKVINAAIHDGACSVALDKQLDHSENKNRLESLGYKYSEYYSERDGDYTISVSWYEAK